MIQILSDSSSASAITWLVVLVAALFAGFWVVVKLKRWLMAPDEPARVGFTLSDLRRLHKEGRMTDAEFEKAKLLIVGAAKAPLDKPGSGSAAGSTTQMKPPTGRSSQL